MNSNLIASAGVFMCLLAFFLNLFGIMKLNSWNYLLLNLVGGALSCYASYLITFYPFIILEGTWSAVAAIAISGKLFGWQKKRQSNN